MLMLNNFRMKAAPGVLTVCIVLCRKAWDSMRWVPIWPDIPVHQCMLGTSEGAVPRRCQSVPCCAGPLPFHPPGPLQSH